MTTTSMTPLLKKSIQTSLQVNHLAKECDKYDEKIDE
jgi:hypothetical protein